MSSPTVRVTRRVHFNAAHKMWNPAWSKEQNLAHYGPCAHENWHGHNFELEVSVEGPIGEDGYVFDLGKLKLLVHEHVLQHVDHKNLNLDVPFLQGMIPSTENFVVAIWQQLEPVIQPAKLVHLRLYETPRNYVEYSGR